MLVHEKDDRSSLTREQVEALLAGCEGVTAGPYGTTRHGEVGPYSQEDDQSFGMVLPMVDVYGDNAKANQQYFARCDPDTIAALCRGWLAVQAVINKEKTNVSPI